MYDFGILLNTFGCYFKVLLDTLFFEYFWILYLQNSHGSKERQESKNMQLWDTMLSKPVPEWWEFNLLDTCIPGQDRAIKIKPLVQNQAPGVAKSSSRQTQSPRLRFKDSTQVQRLRESTVLYTCSLCFQLSGWNRAVGHLKTQTQSLGLRFKDS